MQQPSVSLNDHTGSFGWGARARAAAIHLGLSALVALLAGLLVFAIWYPFPYREVSGGRDLFQLVVAVDVALGPLITFAVFNRAKPRTELRRDLAIVGLMQLAGLAYGLWTVHLARPVHMVFEYDRFRVVHQVEIPPELLPRAPAGIDAIPWGSPTLLSLRPFRTPDEKADMTLAALEGVPLSARPELWQSYDAGRQDVLAAAQPVARLQTRFPAAAAQVDAILRAAGSDAVRSVYLPLVGRKAQAWTVLLDARTADVIGYLPLDSF